MENKTNSRFFENQHRASELLDMNLEYDTMSHELHPAKKHELFPEFLSSAKTGLFPALWELFFDSTKSIIEYVSLESYEESERSSHQKEAEDRVREEISRYYHWM